MDLLHMNILQNLEEAEIAAQERRQQFEQNINVFETLSDSLFMKHFRLSKNLTLSLVEILDDFLTPPSRVSAINKQTKILIALNFFATGSYQTVIGSNTQCSTVSQATVSRCVEEVVNALNDPAVFREWVRFPNTTRELEENRRRFFQKYHIPGIVGVIDCTHVAIFPPSNNDAAHPEHIYVNRKQYHSLNVQLVCDLDLKIINVNARFPGSAHDSHIWNNSALLQYMINLNRRQEGFFLIGDSGYALRPWLQTPLRHPVPGTPDFIYNEALKEARSNIERCNGLLKMRFRCLLKHRILHYTPTKAAKIINACVVLHNMCIVNNLHQPDREEDFEEFDLGVYNDNQPVLEVQGRDADLLAGRRIQRQIIDNYFRM